MGCEASTAAVAAEDVQVGSLCPPRSDVRSNSETCHLEGNLGVTGAASSVPDEFELEAATTKMEPEIKWSTVAAGVPYDLGEASVPTSRRRFNQDKWSQMDISAKLATRLAGAGARPAQPIGVILNA